MAQDNFKNQIIESDVDSDIVYEKEKPDRYKEILEELDRDKLPSSKPVINLTSQSYVNEHSIGTPGHDSVIEYIDRESDLSQHLAGSTEENLNKLKTFWNLSVGALAEYILDNFRTSYQEDEINIAPKRNGEQKGIITKMDILAADAQWSDELSDAVRPLVNIDGETYDRVRNEDCDLKVDSNGNEIDYPYGLENKSRDLFNLPIEDSSNLTYTRYKEWYKKDNYGTRLIMPKNVRRVEIEDLNRNFWVIAQTIATLSSYIFDDGPISTALKGFSSEIVQLWENTIYLWIRIYYEHNKEAQDNIILTFPLPAEGVLTSNKYNNYYAIDEHWIENEGKDVDGHSQMGVALPNDDFIKEEIVSRLSYLIDKHPKSNICVIPYIKLNNYKKNYYSAVYYPGIYFYRRNKNKVYFRFFKVGENNDRLIIKHEDYSTSLSAISSDNDKYIYPASIVEFYLEKEANIYYSGIRTQIKQDMEITIEQENQEIRYYLKDFELYLYDMVDKGRKFGDPLIKTLGKKDINLIVDEDILLEEKEGEIEKTKSSTILDNYRDIPYYLGEIVSNKKKTTKDGNYRVTGVKDQVDTPEKVLGGFTAPLFLFNQDFSDYITIKKDNNDIKFEVKIDDAIEDKTANYYWINFSHRNPPASGPNRTYDTLYIPEHDSNSVYYDIVNSSSSSEIMTKPIQQKGTAKSKYTINNGMKNLSFSQFKERAGLNQEDGKYWTDTLSSAKNAALNYLMDNISAQETITSSSGQGLEFTKKETKDSGAYNFFANRFSYYVYNHTWVMKKMSELISSQTSFDNDWSESSAYGVIGPPKDADTIQKNYLNKVNNYKKDSLEENFDLQFFYEIFFKPNFGKEDYTVLTFINDFGTGRSPGYHGTDPKTYGMYGVLAIIGRYAASNCSVAFPLPYYWRYIFDNKINDLSIYDKDKTLNNINNSEDNTQKAIVSQDYKTDFNSKKIHPFITYSKGGLSKVKSKEGEKTVYTITLKQELISKITFFIEADYLTGEQAQSLDQVCDNSGKLLGYAIRWEGLDINMGNIPFNEIEFGAPEICQISRTIKYSENTQYEAIKFSSNESWWDDFFRGLTANDVYPDSLNNYISDNQNGVNHYYIAEKKNDTINKVEKELNQGKRQAISESQMKEHLLRILKRDPQVNSKITFPFTYGKKKYNLILITETINGETETTGDIISVT